MKILLQAYRKHRYKFITPITILFTIINLISLYFIIEVNVTSNDECVWEVERNKKGLVELVFTSVKFNGVTWEAGIRDGDKLIAINDFDLMSAMHAQAIINNIPAGNYAKYKIDRNGEIFETKVYIKKLITYNLLAINLLALFWVFAGYLVLRSKPEGYTQRLFFRIGIMYSLYGLLSILEGPEGSNPIMNYQLLVFPIWILYLIGISYLPFVICRFFMFFPKELGFANKRGIRNTFIIVPTVILILLFSGRMLAQIQDFPSWMNYFNAFLGTSVNFLIELSLLVGLISLFINYMRLKTKIERNSIFLILISFTIGVLSIIYFRYLVDFFADTRFNNPEYYLPIIFIVLIPISFGYSIFRYSLMDVSDVIKNTIIYGTATVLIAGSYFFVIYVLGQSLSSIVESDYQGAIAASIFILFAVLFQSTKDRFQNVLTQKFYPEQFMYQKVIMKFSNEIGTIVGLDNILDHMYETLVDALKIDKFGILLKKENCFELVREKGFSNRNLLLNVDEEKLVNFIEKNKKNRLPAVVEREEIEKVFTESIELLDEKIYTLIPLIVNYRVVGILLYGLKYSGSRFSGKDLRLLETASNQSTVAIENARLYELEAKKLKIERDLENAKTIQESLLPAKLPYIPGLDICGIMTPAMQIGGDYFDVIKVSDSKVFIIVGDVSGKGFSASFYMSQLHTMMHLFCTEDKSPKEILMEVNKRIFETIGKNWFITISLALFDSEEKSVKFCRAGHTPLMITNNGTVDFHIPKGIGVGLEKGEIFNSTLEEKFLKYKAGDKFVFYSDGITEEMNDKNELFGENRFEKILAENSSASCRDTLDKITSSLKEFRKYGEQNDDITLVLVKAN